MQNALHDEIDANEEYREKALAIVEAIKARAKQIAAQHTSFEETLNTIAAEVEAELAELTTQAARTGLAAGRKRADLGKRSKRK